MTRVLLLLLLAAAMAVWAPAASPQATPSEPGKTPALSLDDLLTLLASGVTSARAATLVKERGVSFELTEDAEKKLRLVGADDALLLAIARAKPIPPPKAEPVPEPVRPPPPPVDKARAALDKAIEAFGGLAELESLRDFTATGRVTLRTSRGDVAGAMTEYWLVPDKVRQDFQVSSGLITVVYDGQRGWTKNGDTVNDMTPIQMENWRRIPPLPLLLLEAHRGERTLQLRGSDLVEGHECDVLVVSDRRGHPVNLYIEKTTGRVLQKESLQFGDTGLFILAVHRYYDFRPAGDYVVPFRQVLWHNAQKVRESVIESWQFNTFVDPSLFVRPATKPAREQPSRRK